MKLVVPGTDFHHQWDHDLAVYIEFKFNTVMDGTCNRNH